MTVSQTNSALTVEVIPALPEQAPILANLLEFYIYDFSEFVDLELGADGRFGYKQLPLYWTESNRYPFLVRVNGLWAGFVFVRKGSQISGAENVWDVAEFFIIRGYRRRGIGKHGAHKVWQEFPGNWEVRVIDRNQKAREFWELAINEFLGEIIEPRALDKNGIGWHVFSFESNCAV